MSMRKLASASPWVTAVVSWALATGLVSGLFVLWSVIQGDPVQWSMVRDAAFMAAPLALVLAWRDSRSRK